MTWFVVDALFADRTSKLTMSALAKSLIEPPALACAEESTGLDTRLLCASAGALVSSEPPPQAARKAAAAAAPPVAMTARRRLRRVVVRACQYPDVIAYSPT